MLYKQARHGSKNKFFSQKSSTTYNRQLVSLRDEQVQGVYVPKNKRLQKKKDIESAHFSMGNETCMPKMSYGQALISESLQQTNNSQTELQAKERMKMVEVARKSNFQIGELNKMKDSSKCETSNQIAYNVNHLNKQRKDFAQMPDFKKANFKFGSNRSGVGSQSFTYGNDMPQYVSMNKNHFVKHDMVSFLKDKKPSNASNDQRREHFRLGSYQESQKEFARQWRSPTPILQEHAEISKQYTISRENSQKKLSPRGIPQQGSTLTSNTENFCIGSKQMIERNRFLSLNKEAMESIKIGGSKVTSPRQRNVQEEAVFSHTLKNVRNANFNLGNNQTTYISQTNNAMIEHPISAGGLQQLKQDTRHRCERMGQANFRLQRRNNEKTQESTYKNWISDQVQIDSLNPGCKQQLQSNLKLSSVNIGTKNQQLESITETAQQFTTKQNNPNNKSQNKELKTYLKGHHFDFGIKGYIPKTTTNRSISNFTKGSLQILENRGPKNSDRAMKSFVDDQNSSHFKMGYDQRATSASYIKTGQNHVKEQSMHTQSGRKLQTVENLQIIVPPSSRNSWGGNIALIRPQSNTHKNPSDTSEMVRRMSLQNRGTHIVYAQGQSQIGPSKIKTSNQTSYKWIQPVQHIRPINS